MHNYSTDIQPVSVPGVPFVPMTRRPAATTSHERVLVVSIDGLAPRVITPTTMPNLCGLALAGASCFEARTVEPPITVPAHASMFHGVEPAVHHLVDNTWRRPDGPSRSFLAVARATGRSTASVLCWLPLDELIEPDAADHRVTFDRGYDPHDDDVVTERVVDLLRSERPDVTLAYLVACDLAGHASGWGSPEYVAAATRTDELLGALVAAAGPDTAIVVTTDHGGVGRSHGEPLPDTMATFVTVRSARVAPCSMWPGASILDVAPTVADLAGVAPDAAWVGRSLVGAERPIVDHLLDLTASMADHSYGERVDMLSHALQAAACARRDGGSDELVLAALLHDIGHVLADATGAVTEWGAPDHAEVGARHLQAWFGPGVIEPVRGHVEAKRYLVATDPSYLAVLSPASVATLHQQGGACTPDEAAAFGAREHAAAAVALRRCDDAGKQTGLDVLPLAAYRALIDELLMPGASPDRDVATAVHEFAVRRRRRRGRRRSPAGRGRRRGRRRPGRGG